MIDLPSLVGGRAMENILPGRHRERKTLTEGRSTALLHF